MDSVFRPPRPYPIRVRGLDLSSRFAAFARKRYDLNIDVGYIEEFAMPHSHYDVICSFGGIACWRDPIQAFANIREALKPDGIFVMNHFDVDSLPSKILGNQHLNTIMPRSSFSRDKQCADAWPIPDSSKSILKASGSTHPSAELPHT